MRTNKSTPLEHRPIDRRSTVHSNLESLASLIRRDKEALLSSWRDQVRELPAARSLDVPTLNDHLPQLIDELAAALLAKSDQTIPEALREGSAPAHGLQRVQDAFDIEEVVSEYNILRGCIHDLADNSGLSLQGEPFHIVNRIFDQAIGLALQSYSTQQALEVQRRRGEYLAFVAHDLRTPLNAISLAGRVLEKTFRDGAPEAAPARMLKAMRRNVLHIEALVDKVIEEHANLETEAGIKLQCREFDLWPMVESLVHDLDPVDGTGSTRLINQVPDDLVVYADAGLLKRVFQNLVANAIKYTPRGNVSVGARDLGADKGVECFVSDTGAGIPEELISKIFDKGETDPDMSGGSGLGLAIVKTFIKAHGGTVAVDSKEGSGSTFRFSLPAKAKPVATANR